MDQEQNQFTKFPKTYFICERPELLIKEHSDLSLEYPIWSLCEGRLYASFTLIVAVTKPVQSQHRYFLRPFEGGQYI